MRVSLFIVGAPTAGKTTLARALLGFQDGHANVQLVPKPKWSIANGGRIVAAGHYTGGTFDGADRVGYSQVMPTLEYWSKAWQQPDLITIFDGDRFSHAKALEYVRLHSDRVVCVRVRVSLEVQDERIKARGWNPNPTWLVGRSTKSRRFFGLFESGDRAATNELKTVVELLKGNKS